jgi:transcriptional regulator with XRE-family HTH domain
MRQPRHHHLNNLWISRKRIGLGQKSVARLLGHKTTSAVSEYETGRILPNFRTALKLAAIYHVPLSDLYPSLCREIEGEVRSMQRNYRTGTNRAQSLTLDI